VLSGVFFLFFLCPGVPGLQAQPEGQGKGGAFSAPLELLNRHDIQRTPGLKVIFSDIRNSARAGDAGRVREGLARLVELKKGLDTKNLYPVSDLLMIEADGVALLQNFGLAYSLLDGATAVSPDYGRVNLDRASMQFRQGITMIVPAFSSLCLGLKKSWESRSERWVLAGDVIRILVVVTFLAFLSFFLILFLIHIRPLFYDLRSFTPFTYARAPSMIFAVALLLAPFAVGGFKLLLLVLPLFIWGYLGARPRGIIVLFFIFLILLFPLMMKDLARSIVYSNSPVFQSLERMNRGNWDYETLNRLQRELKRKNPTPHAHYALGYIYKKKKDYTKAIAHYNQYLKIYPRDPMTLSNLGTVSFERGRMKKAVKYFRGALTGNPDLFEAHLNLNLAYTELLDTQKAKLEYDKAEQLDPLRTKRFMQEGSRPAPHGNMDCLLPESRLREFMAGLGPRINRCLQSLWRAFVGPVPYDSFPYYLLGIILILLSLYWYKRRSGFSQVCLSCGMVFIDPLQMARYARERCFQCSAASSRKQIIDPKKKKELQSRISRYQDRKKRLAMGLNLLFPGAGFLYAGKAVLGFAFVMFNALFLFAIFETRFSQAGASRSIAGGGILLKTALAYYVLASLLYFISARRE